jgi:tRNA uridine 5-carbamoylmethylation protein Kti12
MKTVVINLFGGPGCGKSTIAAELFAILKKQGYECELVTEYAKDKVWEESYKTLENQIYVFAKQLHRMWRLKDKVQFIITDSPLPLSIIYDRDKNEDLKNLIITTFNSFDNINIVINRSTVYNQNGRYQNEEQANEIDNQIRELLISYLIPFISRDINDVVETILDKIKHMS